MIVKFSRMTGMKWLEWSALVCSALVWSGWFDFGMKWPRYEVPVNPLSLLQSAEIETLMFWIYFIANKVGKTKIFKVNILYKFLFSVNLKDSEKTLSESHDEGTFISISYHSNFWQYVRIFMSPSRLFLFRPIFNSQWAGTAIVCNRYRLNSSSLSHLQILNTGFITNYLQSLRIVRPFGIWR